MEQDRISGAAEIEVKVMEHILHAEDRFSTALQILQAYPSMGSIWNVVNNAFLYGEKAAERFDEMRRAQEKVVENASSIMKDGITIATYSRSSTVVRILKKCAGKKIKVICSESRPNMEGRRLAIELNGIMDVVITTDAALLSLVEEADMILIGADAFTERGVVNKVGTAALAFHAKARDIPLYAAAPSSKAFPFVFIKEERGEEIWDDPPRGVRVRNVYFDFTPSHLITGFITEEGVIENKPEFSGRIAEEIRRIEKIFAERYQRVR